MKNYIEKVAIGTVVLFMRGRLERRGYDAQKIEVFLKRAMADLESATEDMLEYNSKELAILTPRLERRYDIGQAMNEAANRAISAKKAAGTEREIVQLTGAQKFALKIQQEQLQRMVDRG